MLALLVLGFCNVERGVVCDGLRELAAAHCPGTAGVEGRNRFPLPAGCVLGRCRTLRLTPQASWGRQGSDSALVSRVLQDGAGATLLLLLLLLPERWHWLEGSTRGDQHRLQGFRVQLSDVTSAIFSLARGDFTRVSAAVRPLLA